MPGISTDHSCIKLNVSSFPSNFHGPSFWRFNVSLLQDNDYITEIQTNYPKWKQENIQYCDNPSKMWEYLKYKIRNYSIKFSKTKANQLRKNRLILEEEVSILEQTISSESDNDITQKYEEKKSELEKLYNYITDGSIVRSRADWYEMGEKNTNFFLKMEKRNKARSHVRKLLIGNEEVVDHGIILKELEKHYSLKYSRQSNISSEKCKDFLSSVNVPVVNERDDIKTDNIIISELHKALLTMTKGKCPGNDGIPCEFYLKFFNLISQDMVDCFNHSYLSGILPCSQRQATITLLEKMGKDNRYFNGWRPISLFNVDCKILSKILVPRMETVMPKLVGENQSAFIKGRYIGYPLRIVSDILSYTNISALLFAADFESAFDSVDIVFIFAVLDKFGFPKDYKMDKIIIYRYRKLYCE